jgi:CO dehydrogenase maturation factor
MGGWFARYEWRPPRSRKDAAVKIAVTGKGGVGKTTVTSLLAYHFARQGRPVLAIDADPAPCLGPALGFSLEKLLDLHPIAEMGDLISERTGAPAKSSAGAFFKLNPRVSDLPDRFSGLHNGIRLLLLGAVQDGGAGCICPASALLKELVRHVLLDRGEVVLLDLYAGVEHLGRGTAEAVDIMLAVAEPTNQSMRTVRHIQALAADIGITNILLIGNKVTCEADRQFFEDSAADLPLLGCLDASPQMRTADRTGAIPYDLAPELAAGIATMAGAIEAAIGDARERSASNV